MGKKGAYDAPLQKGETDEGGDDGKGPSFD